MCVLMYALPARKGFIPLLAIASLLSRILLGISTHCKPYSCMCGCGVVLASALKKAHPSITAARGLLEGEMNKMTALLF